MFCSFGVKKEIRKFVERVRRCGLGCTSKACKILLFLSRSTIFDRCSFVYFILSYKILQRKAFFMDYKSYFLNQLLCVKVLMNRNFDRMYKYTELTITIYRIIHHSAKTFIPHDKNLSMYKFT